MNCQTVEMVETIGRYWLGVVKFPMNGDRVPQH